MRLAMTALIGLGFVSPRCGNVFSIVLRNGTEAVPRFIFPLDFFEQCEIIVSENIGRIAP